MRKLLALAVIALLSLGANAALAEPGPNGHNEKGLCTAYFNGQKKGHDKNGDPGPFAALERAADDGDGSADEDAGDDDKSPEQQIEDDVFEFCDEYGIMGNPEENGRFDCREGEERDDPARSEDGDQEIECVANGTETPPAE